jgi:formylmethanofuran dehydrogenase subunit B
MERADIKILVDTGNYDSILTNLARSLVDNKVLDPAYLESSSTQRAELPKETSSSLNDLAATMGNAEYCVVVVGEAILNPQFLEENSGFLDRFFTFIKALNATHKVSMLPIFYTWNFAGLVQEISMAGDHVKIVDLQELPSNLGNGSVILSMGSDFVTKLPRDELARIRDVPVISLDFKRTPTSEMSSVVLPVTITGIESGGTVTRLDGVALDLNPPVGKPGTLKSDEDILKELYEKIK